jgi:CubicO group peptidase (beta-lactamase class C family)
MNKNKLRSKGIVLGIVVLFIVVSIVPVTGRIIDKNKNIFLYKQFDSIDILDFDSKIKFWMMAGHMPSVSACIIKNNSVVWSKGYGYYDIKNKKNATDTTIYPIGSVTKTITSTAIMQLYEQELFDLDDNVSKYLPFDLKNPHCPEVNITFRMLLAHQSSLTNPAILHSIYFNFLGFPPDWLEEYIMDYGSIYNPRVWNTSSPGEDVWYSTIGYELLGYLVEQLSHQPFDEYCEEHLLKPLDMTDSSFHLADLDRERLAIPYMWLWLALRCIPLPHMETRCYAGGGVRSTVLDLSHFLIAHMNGGVYNETRILKNETVDLIHTLQYPNSFDEGVRYGLGWYFWNGSDGKTYEGHDGNYPGGKARMIRRVLDNTGVIYYWNQNKYVRSFYKLTGPFEKRARLQIEKLLFQKADEL